MSIVLPSERPIALVSGGSRGIGAAVSVELAKRGFDVAYTYLGDAGETAARVEAKGGRALGLQADLADIGDHARVLDHVVSWGGPIACLVNNAGVGSPRRGDMLDVSADAFDQVLDVNLRGTFFLTQAVARCMAAISTVTPRTIVTVSSVSAEMASIERAEYCLSKSALGMLTKLFSLRLAPLGIGVFEVRPGVIWTEMTAGVSEKYDRLIAEGLVPMQRWGQPEDVARAVGALANGQLAYATGSVLNVDGAMSVSRL